MKRLLITLLSGIVLVLGLGIGANVTAGAAVTDDQVCRGLDSGKIDVQGSRRTITVTAPEGFLIDGYCVKAASVQNDNGPVYVDVDPPQETVTIFYPSGKDISHYSVSYVPAPTPPRDVCPNLDGNQDAVPPGYVMQNGECVLPPPPPHDECSNLPGNQPDGFQCYPRTETEYRTVTQPPNCETGTVRVDQQKRTRTQQFVNGAWVWGAWSEWMTYESATRSATQQECPAPPHDVCPNIEGTQTTVPSGLVKDSYGNCVPPHDECPNMPGPQPDGTNCNAPPPPPDCEEFCPVPTQGYGPNLVCNGSYTGTYNNVTVPRGKTCILQDSYVNGSVTTWGARGVYILDTTVVGDVLLRGVTGDVRIGNKIGCNYDPRIGGSLLVKDSHNFLGCQLTVCENVSIINNDGKITFRDSAVKHTLRVTGNSRFDPDGQSTHRNEKWIRLLNLRVGDLVVSGNAPRRVVQQDVVVLN